MKVRFCSTFETTWERSYVIHTEDIIQEIRTEFESMLTYIKGSTTETADQVERGIFARGAL